MRLVVQELACERGGRTVFDNLSFTVEQGSGLVLTGPNGVGKTSLLRILAGLLRPATGHVCIQNDNEGKELAEHVHFIGMKDAIKPNLTAREHARHWGDLLSGEPQLSPGGRQDEMENRRNCRDEVLLAEMMLSQQADLPAFYLSAGQRRKLALARLFTAVRRVWLLDEPFNALDETARTMLRLQLTRFMASGGILILATHEAVALKHTKQLSLKRDMRDTVPEPLA